MELPPAGLPPRGGCGPGPGPSARVRLSTGPSRGLPRPSLSHYFPHLPYGHRLREVALQGAPHLLRHLWSKHLRFLLYNSSLTTAPAHWPIGWPISFVAAGGARRQILALCHRVSRRREFGQRTSLALGSGLIGWPLSPLSCNGSSLSSYPVVLCPFARQPSPVGGRSAVRALVRTPPPPSLRVCTNRSGGQMFPPTAPPRNI